MANGNDQWLMTGEMKTMAMILLVMIMKANVVIWRYDESDNVIEPTNNENQRWRKIMKMMSQWY